MKGLLLASAAVLAALFCTACSGNGSSPNSMEQSPAQRFVLDMKNYPAAQGPFKSDAHKAYLSEPLVFKALPDGGIGDDKTAVVGSRVCRFYPDASLGGPDDLAKLPEGIPVPFGTILPIKGPAVETSDAEHGNMFEFEENWNWFYPTEFGGQKGLVFGADLYGIDDSAESNKVSSLLYTTGGRFDAFYPVTGYRPLSDALQTRLREERLAIQNVRPNEYWLDYGTPDDMISLYTKHQPVTYGSGWGRKSPVFITTDLIAHAQHLMFDRLLQYLEEFVFAPRLSDLCAAMIKAIESDTGTVKPETREKARLYVQTALALLRTAPVRTEDKDENGGRIWVYSTADSESILQSYPKSVRDELALMDKAAGFAVSPVFSFADNAAIEEDYSQYKPRGHYTKNGVLSAWFRAMMWFGRVPFLMGDPAQMSNKDARLARDMTPVALYLTDLAGRNAGLYKAWFELQAPISDLIGLADDLGPGEVLPLWQEQKVTDFGVWQADTANIDAFLKLAHQRLKSPAVSGASVFTGPKEGSERKAPLNWRLFGQRFTHDSFIHNQVSPPRLMSRDMVRGLDIMKAFGSRTAELLLGQSDYPRMPGLKEALDKLEKQYAAWTSDDWGKNFYSSVLYQIKTQALFEPGTGFYFTESPAWGIKAMTAAHGTWAELRHDTLLYVKQSYAERAGDGDFYPTFRIEDIPDPVHYVEPNVPFWQGTILATQKLHASLSTFGLMDEETDMVLRRFRDLCDRGLKIAEQESKDEAVSPEDLKWIPTIPAELAHLVLVHAGDGESLDSEQLKMALIADVYTNAEIKQVLETAVGIPFRMYVPLNDGQGGKRIAVGYTFSYYEFTQDMAKRLTDEAWKQKVYNPGYSLETYAPFWAAGRSLPAESGD